MERNLFSTPIRVLTGRLFRSFFSWNISVKSDAHKQKSAQAVKWNHFFVISL